MKQRQRSAATSSLHACAKLHVSSAPPSAARFEKLLQRLGERFAGAEAQRVHAGLAQGAVQFRQPLGVGFREISAGPSRGWNPVPAVRRFRRPRWSAGRRSADWLSRGSCRCTQTRSCRALVMPISWTMSRPACDPARRPPKLCRKSVNRKTIERRLTTWFRKASAPGMFVPLCLGSKNSISLMVRKIWRRPLRGGRNNSTWSVNSSRPTLSLLRAAEQARVRQSPRRIRACCGARNRSAGGGNIHRQDDAQFAFLAKALDERPAHAVGDVPINVAHVVAGHVFAQFLEIHAAPLEMAQVRADHHVIHQPVGADFHPADGFENFLNGHGQFKRARGTRWHWHGVENLLDDVVAWSWPAPRLRRSG